MDNIRVRFLENFETIGKNDYPNILFDYQKKIELAGHFSAYNHWLLMKGDENAFGKWKDKHSAEWDSFIKWYSDNALKVSGKNMFHSSMY